MKKAAFGLKGDVLALSLLGAITFAPMTASAQTDADLLNPAPQNWVTLAGNYNSHSYSELDQINVSNAKNMEAKWAYHVPGTVDLETTPVVYNGIMYISGFNRVDALDARTGNVIWRYRRQPDVRTPQRGTAIYDGKVYIPTSDGHLVALDARTGRVIWDVPAAAEGARPTGGAMFVAKGKLIIGGNGPGGGTLSAYDAKTGKYLWTWNSIPAKGTKEAETWGGVDPRTLGGANIWRSGSFDPEQNLLIWGTGSPPNMYSGDNRPGDNLYVDSIVAVDVDTGKLKWHFQTYPHDVHDWDAHESLMLADMQYEGKPRKLLLQANRNGFYYVLDRTTGKFLGGKPFIELDWASGLTPEGRPILVPGHVPTLQGTRTCPPSAGANNWPNTSYSPQTQYVYVHAMEGCGIYIRANSQPNSGGSYIEDETAPWQIYLRALDARTGKLVWERKAVRSNHYGPGVLSTAGGIVFAPELFGQVSVLNAKTGEALWHFNTGDLITANPVAYAVDGQEYLAIVVNTHVYTFGLGNAAK